MIHVILHKAHKNLFPGEDTAFEDEMAKEWIAKGWAEPVEKKKPAQRKRVTPKTVEKKKPDVDKQVKK